MLSLFLLITASSAIPLREKREIPAGVPSYVIDYAPMVYLHSGERYMPSDIGAQITNTHPVLNSNTITPSSALTLENLNQLNTIPSSNNGDDIFLTSNLDPTTSPRPPYLYGTKPLPSGETPNAITATIITVPNPSANTLDAFYFYFYAFNDGGTYFSLSVGNHIGDWEHNMIRFNTTTNLPLAVYYSQHSSGQAFTYPTTLKSPTNPLRPLAYSANGTHANYAIPGAHDHTIPNVNLPFGPIQDFTDAGTLWDPTLAAYFYDFSPSTGTFTPYDSASPAPGWLEFNGRWGDARLPQSDPRQDCAFGITALCEYSGGPTGPADKGLVRGNVCPDGKKCPVFPVLLPKRDGEGMMGEE